MFVLIVGPPNPTQIAPVLSEKEARSLELHKVLEATLTAREKWNCIQISLMEIKGKLEIIYDKGIWSESSQKLTWIMGPE